MTWKDEIKKEEMLEQLEFDPNLFEEMALDIDDLKKMVRGEINKILTNAQRSLLYGYSEISGLSYAEVQSAKVLTGAGEIFDLLNTAFGKLQVECSEVLADAEERVRKNKGRILR